MRQRTAVLVVVAVAALVVLASAATAAATGLDDVRSGVSGPGPAATDAAANGSVSPGQRLSGVIGAQRAEVEGEIETRSFGVRVVTASSSRSKAGVVAAELNDLEGRLDTLQNRRAELERAHENGNVSDGVYQAQATELAARIETAERRVDAADEVATDLPERDLEAAGVRRSNISRLRQRATDLSKHDAGGLARSVVGDDVGEGMGDPASSVLDTTASGNFSDGEFVGGNAGPETGTAGATETGTAGERGPPERTGAPGRETRTGERAPGADAGANASVGNGTGTEARGSVTAGGGTTAGVGANASGATETGSSDGNANVTVGANAGTASDEISTNETTAANTTTTTDATSTTANATTTTDSPFVWDSATATTDATTAVSKAEPAA